MRLQSGLGGYAAVILTAVACAACSSSSSSPTTDVDASTPEDSGPAADTGSPDASVSPVNGCGPTQFAANDHSAANDPRAITFAPTATPMQFSPNCMSIKAGQSVTWTGDFTDHPFEPMPALDNDPIMEVTSGTTATVTFPVAGTFGYDCANHPSIMLGAIQVVP
jgi:plastocyanin